jgi:hypothetical protein
MAGMSAIILGQMMGLSGRPDKTTGEVSFRQNSKIVTKSSPMTAHLSAQTALNIPNEHGHFTDWHLLEAFGGEPAQWQARCIWVGDGPGRRSLDTRTWLGNAGVWDATDVLAR